MGEKFSIIIVAGGRGSRFGSSTPKQFLLLNGTPILCVTVEQFLTAYPLIEIIVVLPEDQLDYGQKLLSHYPNLSVIAGGKERFHSVQNGLSQVGENRTVVGVHDGVRPLVKVEVIFDAFEGAEKNGNAIPILPMEDSMRQLTENNSMVVNRKNYVRVQTPQCFQKDLLQKAYSIEFNESFTDDASVVQSTGEKIYFVNGNKENIKITTPVDLKLAEFYKKER